MESFVPDPTWENFQRPSKEPDSLGFGFPRFVSHETLKKRQFVKDDTLFIRVKVDPSKIIAVWNSFKDGMVIFVYVYILFYIVYTSPSVILVFSRYFFFHWTLFVCI